MDPITLKIAEYAAKKAVGHIVKRDVYPRLASILDPDTRFAEAWKEVLEEFTLGAARKADEAAAAILILAEMQGRLEEMLREVNERVEDQEARAVWAKYGLQAWQEPLDERRRMLEYAAAGIVDTRLSVAEHARVQRLLIELDPPDVIDLYALSRTYHYMWGGQRYGNEGEMKSAFLASRPGAGDALFASNCVRYRFEAQGAFVHAGDADLPDWPFLEITNFGRLVLRVLRGYCRATTLTFEIPGREHVAGERSRDEAYEAFPALSQLREALAPVIFPRPETTSRYMAPSWSMGDREKGKNCQPPNARTCARIDVEELSGEQAEALRLVAPVSGSELNAGTIVDAISIATSKIDGTNHWTARISGPHDALRHLVDELDIRWF